MSCHPCRRENPRSTVHATVRSQAAAHSGCLLRGLGSFVADFVDHRLRDVHAAAKMRRRTERVRVRVADLLLCQATAAVRRLV